MPYTSSKSQIGLGTTLSIGSGTGTPETFTLIGELKTISQSGRSVSTEDVTNLQSGAKEFIPTLVDSGTYDISGNYVGGDAGQAALETAFASLVPHNFQLQLPKGPGQTTKGDVYTFLALVQEKDITLAVDKAVTFSAKLKVSGVVTSTPGT